MSLTISEAQETGRANDSGLQPVVFVHGLWMLASSWQPWRSFFEDNGYATVAPGWPDDPQTIAQARASPEVFAGKSIRQVTDHMAEVISALQHQPAVIGHSFGGLITQQLAGRGLAAVSVPIDSAPFRGVLPLPLSALRSAFPVIGNPANYRRAVTLTYEQFRFSFANAVSENEARRLYEAYPVAGSGIPLFQAATANINPFTEAKVDSKNPRRGPMLIITGEKDHIAPHAIASASYKKQKRNRAATDIHEIPDRGHSLVFDSGWQDVAEAALAFIKKKATELGGPELQARQRTRDAASNRRHRSSAGWAVDCPPEVRSQDSSRSQTAERDIGMCRGPVPHTAPGRQPGTRSVSQN